jgi:glycosyltransferase involved in cell wall biosynthesis
MIKLAIVGLDIGPGSFGGVNNYTKLILKYLDKDKTKFHYYSLGKSPNWYSGDDKPTLFQFIIHITQRIILFPFFIKNNKIEVAHINSGLTQISLFRESILSFLAKINGCKTLFFIHGWKEKELNKILRNIFKKMLFIYILKKQDGIVVLADQFRKKIIDLGVDGRKIFVTSTMVESDLYRPEKKIFSKPFNVLFCANMVKEKGPFELLESIPMVLKEIPDTNFTFIGNGKDLEVLKSKSLKLGIDKNTIFTGYVNIEKKIKLFKEAHIFAFPTYYGEGFPTVILEAMAAGLPVITTPNAGLKNAIENGKEGFFLSSMPSDSSEIATKIIYLIKNPNTLEEISKNNQLTAQNKYDVRIITNKMIDIYNQI